MDVWRIGYYKNPALSVREIRATMWFGTTLGNGRWHRKGHALVYAASSRALTQLEKRVHCNGRRPVDQALFKIILPDDIEVLDVSTRFGLPAKWQRNEVATQDIGIEWLMRKESLAMWVPSVVVANERNILINPQHRHYSRIGIEIESHPFEFDPRLFDN